MLELYPNILTGKSKPKGPRSWVERGYSTQSGDIFQNVNDKEYYLVVDFYVDDHYEYRLVCLHDGVRWSDTMPTISELTEFDYIGSIKKTSKDGNTITMLVEK